MDRRSFRADGGSNGQAAGRIWVRVGRLANGLTGKDLLRQSCVMQIALYQPDIPQNAGAIARLCACLGAPLHIIEPAGFDASDRNFRRAGMDYLERAGIVRHASWSAFDLWRRDGGARLLLATTKGSSSHLDWAYAANDVLLLGRESAGVPEEVHSAADARLIVPMRSGLRSLNVALAAALILGESMRQTGGFPPVARADMDTP